jgi:hypothetical protein
MNVANLFHYLLLAVASASLALIALSWLEGAVTIWLPRTPSSRFWNFFDKLLSTLRYVSASEEKLSRARFAFPSINQKEK